MAGYDRYSRLGGQGGGTVKTAVVILFHGSRAEGSGDIAKKIAAEVGMQGGFGFVTAAFLQHGMPDLTEAVEGCIQQGASEIVVVPFFLQVGVHVTADIPRILDQVKKRYPAVRISMTGAVGSHPQMAEIIMDLVRKNADHTGSLH